MKKLLTTKEVNNFKLNGAIVLRKKFDAHWIEKLNISNYGILWISFIKGLIIGLLIYHFFFN